MEIYDLPEGWENWPVIAMGAIDCNEDPCSYGLDLPEEHPVHWDEESGVYATRDEAGDIWYFDPAIEWQSDYDYYREGCWVKLGDVGQRRKTVEELTKVLDGIEKGIARAIELAVEAKVPLSLERMFRGDLANVQPTGECWYTSYC